MQRVPVISKTIRSIGYDAQMAVLEVEFSLGDVYRYLNVPEHLYRNLMSADSKGQFLNEYIRYNYRYQKIR